MTSSRKSCLNDPDVFCYICGQYTLKPNRNHVTSFIKRAYLAYFGVKLGDQDKPWVPHIVCKTCTEHLRQWTQGKRKSMNFGIPMIWREPQNHHDDCYFCAINVKGINRINKKVLVYPDLQSARLPRAHCDEVPVPVSAKLHENEETSSDSDEKVSSDDFVDNSSAPQPFNQEELNDLVREMNLSKKSAEVLASRLKEKNLLLSDTRITYYRERDTEFIPFFTKEDNFVFCNNV